MANSYTKILIHYVFSTKYREKTITSELQERLWAYMGGIAKQNNMKAIAIGGVADHVHLLISLSPTISVSKAVQLIKGGSSKWVHDTFPNYNNFTWQKGYGAFSVRGSHITNIVAYINNQHEHHFKKTFQDEYVSLLKKHAIEYDDRYLFD